VIGHKTVCDYAHAIFFVACFDFSEKVNIVSLAKKDVFLVAASIKDVINLVFLKWLIHNSAPLRARGRLPLRRL